MGMLVIQRHCPHCEDKRPFEKPGVNHLVHFVLTCFTIGFWLIIWILACVISAFKTYRCRSCGGSTGYKGESSNTTVIFVGMFVLASVIIGVASNKEDSTDASNKASKNNIDKKDLRKSTPQESKIDLRKKICAFPPDKFKKYIRKNQKKIKKNKEYVHLSRELNLQIDIKTKKNKQLVKQIKAIMGSDLSEEESKQKVSSLKKEGRSNVAKIKELKEKLKFLDEVFTAEK